MGLLVSFALAENKVNEGQFYKFPKFFLGGIILFASLYLIMSEDAFYDRGQNFNWWDWAFSILAVVGALELARRTTGWVIPILAVLALTYATFWGRFVTGVFHFPGLTWETMLYRATYGGDGMFGTVARISWTYVFMFILFGTMLLKSGASEVILGLARRAAERFVGGPGLVAVFSSGLMGSVSGSAIGNTVSTGIVTIPLMRQSGFPARTAAGIEAASSTGGQLMPPVMGAGAFLMAAYTGENYMTIIGVAALPALLYFLSVAFQVRCVALRLGLNKNLSKHEDTAFSQDWPVLIPIAILVGLLITGFTPTWSAGMASVACIICARFGRRPMGLKDVIDGLAQASLTAAPIAVLLIAVGLVIMAVTTTGLGPTVSQMIINWSGGSLVLTLILVALASLVLGLGLPVTAAYVVLAPLAAPALADLILQAKLIEALMGGTLNEGARVILLAFMPEQAAILNETMSRKMAIEFLATIPLELRSTISDQGLSSSTLTAALLSAHMIVFWLSQDSNVTPPVCLTAYAAAGIAGTKPVETGFTAWGFAKGIYVIPLVIAFTPLVGGNGQELAGIVLFTGASLYAFAGSLQGYLEGPLRPTLRLLTAAVAVFLIWPHGSWSLNALALAILAAIVWISKRSKSP